MMNLRLSFFVSLLLMLTQQSIAQAIFSGGNDDGFTVSCYAQADNPTLAIFSGGNDDGFTVSCYDQGDIPTVAMFNGGNDDGFGFSSVGGEGTEVPLPIELISLKAYVQNDWVNIEWQTASEINNDYFTIEKSKTATDWVIVAQINGAGNSNTVLSYNTIDQTPYNGISYYRLKQTDFDGKYSYSQIRAVNIEQSAAEVVIYPNPANNQITIQADEQELSEIKIYNILGQDVTNLTSQLSKSGNSVIIDLSNLANGIYTVKTVTAANMVIKK